MKQKGRKEEKKGQGKVMYVISENFIIPFWFYISCCKLFVEGWGPMRMRARVCVSSLQYCEI
jgi:hypothetical protein